MIEKNQKVYTARVTSSVNGTQTITSCEKLTLKLDYAPLTGQLVPIFQNRTTNWLYLNIIASDSSGLLYRNFSLKAYLTSLRDYLSCID